MDRILLPCRFILGLLFTLNLFALSMFFDHIFLRIYKFLKIEKLEISWNLKILTKKKRIIFLVSV